MEQHAARGPKPHVIQTLIPDDRTLVLVMVLCLLAAWPFLFRSSLPRETDAELHIFRAAQLGTLIRSGVLIPRWAADFYYGYGYPIFNFYAPLTYYLANLLTLAVPDGAVLGVKMVFIAGFLAGGTGTYLTARDLTGSRAGGLIASVTFLFTPYIYLLDPHIRGVLAEFFAICMAPLTLWLLLRQINDPQSKWTTWAAIGIAVTLLSHNLMAVMLGTLYGGFTIWQVLVVRRGGIRKLLISLIPHALGIGLSLWFWLPVALESSAVQLGNLVGDGGHFDFRNHFIPARELFGASLPLDLGAVNPTLRYNAGLAQWILALAGIGAIAVQGRKDTATAGFWALISIGLITLILPLSRPLWEALPPMAFIQFPWRLLGPLAVTLSLLAGFTHYWVEAIPRRYQKAFIAGLASLPILATYPAWSPPDFYGSFGPTDREASLEFELGGFALGTTSTGDYLPMAVQVVPDPNPSITEQIRNNQLTDRLRYDTLPDGMEATPTTIRPNQYGYTVSTQNGGRIELGIFDFVGWHASIDDELVPIVSSEPYGFIGFDVPPGTHEIRVWSGSTPARLIGSLITVLSLLILLAHLRWYPDQQENAQSVRDTENLVKGPLLPGLLAAVMAMGFIGSSLHWWQPRSTGVIAQPAEQDIHVFYQDGIDLIGYDMPAEAIKPGEPVTIRLYWKARAPISDNYQVFVHITTIPQHVYGQSDKLNPGDYPTTRWNTDRYVTDPHQITLPSGTPAGEYTVRIGLYDRDTGARLLILNEDNQPTADAFELPHPLIVTDVNGPYTGSPDRQLDVQAADGIILLGVSDNDEPVDTIGFYRFTLLWHAETDISESYEVVIRVLTDEEAVYLVQRGLPADGISMTQTWRDGQITRDIRSIWVDENWAPGTYSVQVGLASAGSVPAGWIEVGQIHYSKTP